MSKTIKARENVFQSSQPLRVDEKNGIIFGVKLLGWDSKNGRKYLPEGVKNTINKYNGAFCNIDHGRDDCDSRFGKFFNERWESHGAFADLRYNPKHERAEKIVWFARNMPDALGFSHDADIVVENMPDGSEVVHGIEKVRSVDLVMRPATTKGIFENMNDEMNGVAGMPAEMPEDAAAPSADFKAQLGELAKTVFMTDEISDAERDEISGKLKHLIKMLGKMGGKSEKSESDESEEDEAPEESESESKSEYESIRKENQKLKSQLDIYKVKEALNERAKTAKRLCKEMGLPQAATTDFFINELSQKGDEKAVREAIEDRKRAITTSGTKTPHAPAGGQQGLTYEKFLANLRTQPE